MRVLLHRAPDNEARIFHNDQWCHGAHHGLCLRIHAYNVDRWHGMTAIHPPAPIHPTVAMQSGKTLLACFGIQIGSFLLASQSQATYTVSKSFCNFCSSYSTLLQACQICGAAICEQTDVTSYGCILPPSKPIKEFICPTCWVKGGEKIPKSRMPVSSDPYAFDKVTNHQMACTVLLRVILPKNV
jgi:hypothetical protein